MFLIEKGVLEAGYQKTYKSLHKTEHLSQTPASANTAQPKKVLTKKGENG